jgi:hypothetical protein
MCDLFADLPEAIDNTVEIAMRCGYYPKKRNPILPRLHRRHRRSGRGREGGSRRTGAAEARTKAGDAHRHRRHRPGFSEAEYRERLEFELGVIEKMKYPGLLPDRRRLHPMGQGAGHSGRAGPRLGRRLAGRLWVSPSPTSTRCASPAVRALPQSRPRVDAGLRHRLLPGPARGGDPLRAGQVRHATRSRRSSPSERCRRAPCCATSAACCRCPTARSTASQDGAGQSGQPGERWRARSRKSRSSGDGRRGRAGRQTCSTSARSSKASTATPRPTPPASSSATGRCRAGAAVPRSALRHAGHAVQHEVVERRPAS